MTSPISHATVDDRLTAMVHTAAAAEPELLCSSSALFAKISARLTADIAQPDGDPAERAEALVAQVQRHEELPVIRDPDALFARIGAEIAANEVKDTTIAVRSDDILIAAREYEPELRDPDQLYERVAAQIARRRVEDRVATMTSTARRLTDDAWNDQVVGPGSVANDDALALGKVIDGRDRWRRAALVAAAAAVAIFMWTLLRPVAGVVPTSEQPSSVAEVLPGVTTDPLHPMTTAVAAVEVFASADAAWSLTGTHDYVLHLNQGALLVEFVPLDGATLRVETPDTVVQVVGTAFYVNADADGDEVSVVTGAVRVDRHGRTFEVETNEVLGEDDELTEMTDEIRAVLTAWVDPVAHQRRLDDARAATEDAAVTAEDPVETAHQPESERPASPGGLESSLVAAPDSGLEMPSFTHHPSDDAVARRQSEPAHDAAPAAPVVSMEELRERAGSAMEREDWAEAAENYEALLDRTSRRSAAAATTRLELAGVYLNHLDRPGRAERHMRRFLHYNSDDVAASAVREAYCERLQERGELSEYCED